MTQVDATRARRRRRATPIARRAAIAALACAALAACDPYVQGNGIYGEEDRSAGLAPFAGIDVEDGFRVTATESSASGLPSQTVVVTGDVNVLRWVKTEVREETIDGVPTAVLHLLVDANHFVSTNPLRATISARGLRYLRARNGARVETSFAASPHFVLDVADAGDVTLRGPGGDTLRATVDGAFVHATSYPVGYAEVALASGSRVELLASTVAGTADAASRLENVGGTCDVPGTTLLFCCAAPGCP